MNSSFPCPGLKKMTKRINNALSHDYRFKCFTLYNIQFSQSVSQLGTSMTSFALILWVYTQNGSAMFSFLCGDMLMGLGQNAFFWSVAGIVATLPIAFINAGQNVILYQHIPENIQGRVFAVRNALQYSTIPVGILLGGFLADYIFEPFKASEHTVAKMLQGLVGTGAGSGMAVMFLCTGILGCLFSFISYRHKDIQKFMK